MKENLIKIDDLLSKMEVKGDSVFVMVEVRKILKEMFDEVIKNETTVPEQCE